MKQYRLVLIAFVLLLSACNKDNFDEDFSDEDLFEEPTTPSEDEEGALTLYQVTEDQIDRIKDYPVSKELLPYQQDYAKHFKMWDFVTRLLPLEERDKIAEFEVFHGNGDLLGYVAPVDDQDLSRWRFGLAIDAAEELEVINFKDLFTYVTIHEYGHVLSLNDEQIKIGDEGNCNNYFTGEGCSRADSYINRLFELGWKDIYKELTEDNADVIYEKYQDRFVTDYAATNPGEDFAEVFSFFVTQEEAPRGQKLADQKIRLLYEFPELVSLREQIRGNGTTLSLRAGSWQDNPLYKKFRLSSHKSCKHHH